MTMEEHCPHGSGNAVFCDECERDDKKRSADRYKREQKEKELRAEFMSLARGLAGHTVAKLMRQHIAVDYMGSPKKAMAEAWAKGIDGGCKLKDRRGLKKTLKEAPRPTKGEQAAKARKRLVAKKVKRLDTYEAVHGMRSKEMKAVLLEEDDDVLEAYYEAIEKERNEALLRAQNAKKTAERLQGGSLVVDKEIRRRRRNKR